MIIGAVRYLKALASYLPYSENMDACNEYIQLRLFFMDVDVTLALVPHISHLSTRPILEGDSQIFGP